MDFNSEIVGKRLRELREKSGITQKQMAVARQMTQSAIAKQESGMTAIGDEGLCWYADYFNVSTDYLLGRTDLRNVYAHDDLDVGDGRKAVLLSSIRKKLPPEDREQVEHDLQRALKEAPSINLQGCSLSMDALVDLIRQIVDQSLESHKLQDDSECKL